jgi:proton-coupled amino acid transporter
MSFNDRDPLSTFGAVLNLLKFLIGLGIISLPDATKALGWLPSLVGMGVLTFVNVSGIFLAIQARETYERRIESVSNANGPNEEDPLLQGVKQRKWQDMPDYGLGVFDQIVGKVFGWHAQFFYVICIALGQLTTLVLYADVVCANIGSYFPKDAHHHVAILCGLAAILFLLSLIKTLEGVAVVSGLGLCIYAFLFCGLIHELFLKISSGTLPVSATAVNTNVGIHDLGNWFGITCFALNGFPISMVIYDEMLDQKTYKWTISLGFFICFVVYAIFGAIGYLCYGNQTQMLIYFNFPEDSVWRNGSAAALSGILVFSYAIQAAPVFALAARILERSYACTQTGLSLFTSVGLRWTIVASTLVISYLLPNIRVVMNTLGAVSGVATAFFFPAVTYFSISATVEAKEHSICLGVIVVGALGLYYSISSALSQGTSDTSTLSLLSVLSNA